MCSFASPGRSPRAPKAKSARKLGAQPGHKGSFRTMLPREQVAAKALLGEQPHGVIVSDRCGGL
jgi:hypothetical protein